MRMREAEPGDAPEILAVTRAAFPDEDLTGLVSELLAMPGVAMFLVADLGAGVCGYAGFTECRLSGPTEEAAAAEAAEAATLLGPLAVAPPMQRAGLGRALVEAGLRRARDGGARSAFVLGDPAYYGRFGFAPTKVAPPHPIPAAWADAWRAIRFDGDATADAKLIVPKSWDAPALWSDAA